MKGILGILLIGLGAVIAYLILSGKFSLAAPSTAATSSKTATPATTTTRTLTSMVPAVAVGYVAPIVTGLL